MQRLIALAALVSLAGGCYVGSTQSRKNAAYAVNGVLLLTGAALMLSGKNTEVCDNDASCSSAAVGAGAVMGLGAMMAAGGALGIGINVLVPTTVPGDDGVLYVSAPIKGTVTGPGLMPAAVSLY